MAARKATKKIIRESLVRQLELRLADTPYFLGLVDEYMFLLEQVAALKKLLRSEGLAKKEVYNNSGASVVKVNGALKEIRDCEKQMLMILKELKITTDNVISEDETGDL